MHFILTFLSLYHSSTFPGYRYLSIFQVKTVPLPILMGTHEITHMTRGHNNLIMKNVTDDIQSCDTITWRFSVTMLTYMSAVTVKTISGGSQLYYATECYVAVRKA